MTCTGLYGNTHQVVQAAVSSVEPVEGGDVQAASEQRKANESDAGTNRDYWPFHQLETFIRYKAIAAGVKVDVVRLHYTSKACQRCAH
ncbi:MAG: zinc ribbon domain-containing protein [Thermosynechococcus sp.]|uniref:zinc ribbon domain-containing protein n=1 Tax=Thermosynechococcus sp. TaxID=2814275 RepID=UPI00391D8A49